jgi:ferredoxin
MTHVITSLCLRDGACVEVCPVECIVPGKPENEWPWYFIDPDTCIDCGACVPECPYEAIFIEDDVPSAYTMKAGQKRVPFDTKTEVVYQGGEVVDLRPDIQPNADFFKKGPGYDARNM